jgi:hypothetical protein|tara:strand:+ start:568 stop:798 length:231 start_codon:yes stop_codon:yes gene_type:complete
LIAAIHILGIKKDLFLKTDSVLKIIALYAFKLYFSLYNLVTFNPFNLLIPYGFTGYFLLLREIFPFIFPYISEDAA